MILSLLHMIGLLGTSNSLVWGIDECVNTHHLIPIFRHKNDQKHPNVPNYTADILGVCFYVFQVQRIENRAKPGIFGIDSTTFVHLVKSRRSQSQPRDTALE